MKLILVIVLVIVVGLIVRALNTKQDEFTVNWFVKDYDFFIPFEGLI